MSGSGPVNWSVRSELIQADSTSFADITSAIASFLSAGTWHTASTGSGTLTVDSVNDDWRAILQTAGSASGFWAGRVQPSGDTGADESPVLASAFREAESRWIFCNEYQKTNGSDVIASAVCVWGYDSGDAFPLPVALFGRPLTPTFGGAREIGVDGTAWMGSQFATAIGTIAQRQFFWSTDATAARGAFAQARIGLEGWNRTRCAIARTGALASEINGLSYSAPFPMASGSSVGLGLFLSELATQTNDARANLTRLLNTDQDVQWTHVRAGSGNTSVIVRTQAGVSAKVPT